jgi:3',5'-cyclic AMP phosphodiesterase CpdA
MNRRDFLLASSAIAASPVLPSTAAQPSELPKAVESPELTLTPQTSDRWELSFKPTRSMRILQITDTHFSSTRERDTLTARTLSALFQATNPDLIVHTGDFVNNDDDEPISWEGVDFMNRRKKPWALCFGNHDYPVAGARGSRSLEEFRQSLKNCAMGYAELEGKRHYCYRHDVVTRGETPAVTLLYFQVGYAKGDRKISENQLVWFYRQLVFDKSKGWKQPLMVFVHIPLQEYNTLAVNGKAAGGFKNEDVHFDSDTGGSFQVFAASKRVKAIFCGHDHVNNYFGDWEGIGLYYGRVSGWGGYGRWARGGRLIDLDLANSRFTQREVLV